jgi:phage shock protein A
MGIFSRMGDIINANLNAMLDKAEDPEKMVRLMIQEMEDTLVEVRSSAARVLADRKAVARKLEQLRDESLRWEDKARLALAKQRDDLARAALQEKALLQDESHALEQELSATDEHVQQLDQEIGQLQQKLNDAKARQQAIILRGKTVESRMRVRREVDRSTVDEAFARFERFERRVDSLEGQLDAMAMGRRGGQREATLDLNGQIEALVEDERIAADMDRLRAEVGGTKDGTH